MITNLLNTCIIPKTPTSPSIRSLLLRTWFLSILLGLLVVPILPNETYGEAQIENHISLGGLGGSAFFTASLDDGNEYKDLNVLTYLFVDYSFLKVGPGFIGLQAHGEFTFFDMYAGFGVIPKYEVEMPLGGKNKSAAFWAGFNFQFGWVRYENSSFFIFFFNSGPSVGMKYQVLKNMYLNAQVDVNFLRTKDTMFDWYFQTLFAKLGISFQLF